MSFSGVVAEELIRVPLKKTCCRKAFLLGLVCAARPGEQAGEWALYLYLLFMENSPFFIAVYENKGSALRSLTLAETIFENPTAPFINGSGSAYSMTSSPLR